VSIEKATCFLVTCDECRTVFDENVEGQILHFDTADAAMTQIADDGWWITATGRIQCPECWTREVCAERGHLYTDWQPCRCGGAIPAHEKNGCGLWRACQRRACWFHEDSTLADLPTIDEPAHPRR
jgi:hypothetical protein